MRSEFCKNFSISSKAINIKSNTPWTYNSFLHIECGYTHTGGMPMSVHAFCLSSRRAVARIHADGRVEYRTDPNWFTPYMRRETVGWEAQPENLRKSV